MNGPDHYRAAEKALAAVGEMTDVFHKAQSQHGGTLAGRRVAMSMITAAIAEAQVHATLAVAAAQAPGRAVPYEDLPGAVVDGWIAALS